MIFESVIFLVILICLIYVIIGVGTNNLAVSKDLNINPLFIILFWPGFLVVAAFTNDIG